MMFALAATTIGYKDLHFAMDQKDLTSHHKDWSGHMLAHLNSTYLRYGTSRNSNGSPFNPKRNKKTLKRLELPALGNEIF